MPKILVVDDAENNRVLYRDVFGASGFLVEVLENADGAFPDIVAAIEPDIISMDIMLGKNGTTAERDGFDAITVLKSDPRTQFIPIFVLTNFFEEGKVVRAKELGAVDFINVTGQTIPKIPLHYLRYLENPKKYKPVHPAFRKE